MHHECVVVPGFGAFMLNHESARYDAKTQRFLPPSRTLGFNPEVRHNDALLLGSISRREGVSLENARLLPLNRLSLTLLTILSQSVVSTDCNL